MSKKQISDVRLQKPWLLAGIGSALFIAGLLIGYFFAENRYVGIIGTIRSVREVDAAHKLIQPILTVVTPAAAAPASEFGPAMKMVRGIISSEPSGALSRSAVYLRNLGDSHWTGLNENDGYDPASMLKVVIAIAAYRQNEDEPGFLEKRVIMTPDIFASEKTQSFASTTELAVGYSYSMAELVEKMLVDSDNGAKDLLLSAVNYGEVERIHNELSVPLPTALEAATYKISALDYSRFFRVLFNSTYLTRADSERLLEFLSEASFRNGLVAGVPSGTTVAHKFGIHENGSSGAPKDYELHDCGIIYPAAASSTPYFLCVMTEGPDQTELASVISRISSVVYKAMAGK